MVCYWCGTNRIHCYVSLKAICVKLILDLAFFLISNNQFIEQAYFKYMEKYTQSRLRITKCYVQVDDDSQNLVMELQLVKPHN